MEDEGVVPELQIPRSGAERPNHGQPEPAEQRGQTQAGMTSNSRINGLSSGRVRTTCTMLIRTPDAGEANENGPDCRNYPCSWDALEREP
jgi:hypothetical protein